MAARGRRSPTRRGRAGWGTPSPGWRRAGRTRSWWPWPGIVWRRSRGRGRATLERVADLRQRARWGEARAVLEQVRQRLGPSGPEDLRAQVGQAEADLRLVD